MLSSLPGVDCVGSGSQMRARPAEPEQPTISVRAFTEADFPLMLERLKRPHVKQWRDDGDDTLAKGQASFSLEDGLGRYINGTR